MHIGSLSPFGDREGRSGDSVGRCAGAPHRSPRFGERRKGRDRGEDKLLWSDLREPFRKLNIATRFNLLVVGAACISEGVLLAIDADHPLPYIGAVTFATEVFPGRLLESMSEFYRAVFVNKLPLEQCVETARRELPKNVRLNFTSVPRLIEEAILVAVTKADSQPAQDAYFVNALVNSSIRAGRKRSFSISQAIRARESRAPESIDMSVGRLLDYERFPENRERFGIDGATLLKRIRKARPLPRSI
jgi:hypothetical protein